MALHDYLKPQKLGRVHHQALDGHIALELFSWGVCLDPDNVLAAGMFAGRATTIGEFDLLLKGGSTFSIPTQNETITFSGFGRDAYRTFEQELPQGQGRAILYLHHSAGSGEAAVLNGIHVFYVWGRTPDHPDFDRWAARMQDVHRIPVRRRWFPHLWAIAVERGWVQPCLSYGFGCLWEVSVSSEEWAAVIVENLREIERGIIHEPAA